MAVLTIATLNIGGSIAVFKIGTQWCMAKTAIHLYTYIPIVTYTYIYIYIYTYSIV